MIVSEVRAFVEVSPGPAVQPLGAAVCVGGCAAGRLVSLNLFMPRRGAGGEFRAWEYPSVFVVPRGPALSQWFRLCVAVTDYPGRPEYFVGVPVWVADSPRRLAAFRGAVSRSVERLGVDVVRCRAGRRV